MSNKHNMILLIVKEHLGEFYDGPTQISNISFPEFIQPKEICSIQDCNMAGSYLRNYYVVNDKLFWFISNLDYFDNTSYNSVMIEDFVWKHTNTKIDSHQK